MSLSLVLVLAGVVILVWLGIRYATPRGSPIVPDDPLWVAAVERARATIPEMLEHQRNGREVWVKFAIRTKSGTKEHVWGRITKVRGDSLECTIETPPAAPAATAGFGMTEIASAEIEDWQVELEDSRIRGGFTTKAQAEMARRSGQSRHGTELYL
ncbi:MAG TPA: DUF2314 domain-containing protein [Gemmatimonadaceae bacterium]